MEGKHSYSNLAKRFHNKDTWENRAKIGNILTKLRKKGFVINPPKSGGPIKLLEEKSDYQQVNVREFKRTRTQTVNHVVRTKEAIHKYPEMLQQLLPELAELNQIALLKSLNNIKFINYEPKKITTNN